MTARATAWMMLPLRVGSSTAEDEGITCGMWLTVGGLMFICPETFATREAAEAAAVVVREGLQ